MCRCGERQRRLGGGEFDRAPGSDKSDRWLVNIGQKRCFGSERGQKVPRSSSYTASAEAIIQGGKSDSFSLRQDANVAVAAAMNKKARAPFQIVRSPKSEWSVAARDRFTLEPATLHAILPSLASDFTE